VKIQLTDTKTIELEAEHLSTIYQAIHTNALRIANRFAKITAEAFADVITQFDYCIEIGEKRYATMRPGQYPEFDTLEDINHSDFTCSYEYNSACSCHPEMRTFKQSFPSYLLDIEFDTDTIGFEDLDEAIWKEVENMKTEWRQYQAVKAADKERIEAENKRKFEEEEKKTFEALKTKYGKMV
jgi:hypothetical protein